MKTETEPTRGAIRAAEIITMSNFGTPRQFKTRYGHKTVEGIADLIDQQTHARALLTACRDMLRYVQAGPIETAPDRLRCATLLAAAIAVVEGEQ